jgi:hypothetical protein
MEAIKEEESSFSSSSEDEIKNHGEEGPGIYKEDSLNSYNSEVDDENKFDEMEFEDRHSDVQYGFGSDDD